MKTVQLPFRASKDRHRELTRALRQDGLSVQKFFERASSAYLDERHARARFALRAKRGNPERALKVLRSVRQRIEAKKTSGAA